ncbi:gp53 [Listeria phage P35]|uniref:gp53 n=1 Tax=Listeria phage P35 TaxID=330398 RepID=UPI00015C0267|nr:gp53 [Listeria phage P35]AAY53238.1 gp53 [Listeria phage P35]
MIFRNELSENYTQLRFLDKFLEGHNGFIAGGCFKNIFQGQEVKDIDIFFRSLDDFIRAQEYYAELIQKSDDWVRAYKNDRVWAIIHKPSHTRLELIKSTFGEPNVILDNFDFTITKFAYYIQWTEMPFGDEPEFRVRFHQDYFEHLLLKRLVIDNNCNYPVSTFERMLRYQGYGYNSCKDTKLRIITELNEIAHIDQDALSMSLYNGID